MARTWGTGRKLPKSSNIEGGGFLHENSAAVDGVEWTEVAGGVEATASVTADTGTTHTSTSYAELSGSPDTAVTIDVPESGKVLVLNAIGATPGVGTNFYCDVVLSGENTRSASDSTAVILSSPAAGGLLSQGGTAFVLTGLTPGETTFQQVYKVSSGTTNVRAGTSRNLTVIPCS